MENMNNVVMYEKPFKEQIKNNKTSKLIRKAIIGLTLAAGLTFTACGSTEYVNHTDPSVITNKTYEDLLNTYTSEYKMELTPNDMAGLKIINDWSVEAGKLIDYSAYRNNFVYDGRQEDYHAFLRTWISFISPSYEIGANATTILENTIIEDMLNANNLPKEITGLKAEDCSIETEVTEKGITYYAQIRSYNAFEDSETYYRSKITDEGLIKVLDVLTTAKANGVSVEDYNKFSASANDYINVDNETFGKGSPDTEFYKEWENGDLGGFARNIVKQGNNLTMAIYNAIHNQYKFNKWNIADNTIDMSKTR